MQRRSWRFARFAAGTTKPLAGWLTLATFANLDSTLIATDRRASRAASSRRAVALVGVASLVATTMGVATCGDRGYAAASAWGWGGVLLRNQREARPAVARAAAAGLCALAVATLWSRRRSSK